jgi:hypothetical protein
VKSTLGAKMEDVFDRPVNSLEKRQKDEQLIGDELALTTY